MVELILKNIDNNYQEQINTQAFFQVWRNLYLKQLIFHHLKLFNIHYHQRTFNLDSFCAYQFKKYLVSMKLIFSNDHEKLINFLNHLPSGVKSVELGSNNANEPLEVGSFPKTITNLKLNYWFNQELEKGVIGPTIQSLTMGKSFNMSIRESFPSHGLVYLDLGFEFNQPIDPGVLPSTLKTLIISDRFNQKLLPGSFPSSLENLTFGGCYNRSIGINVLGENLVTIEFGYSFNKRISIDFMESDGSIRTESLLPNKKLKSIKFGSKFDKYIEEGVLPSTLEIIEFSVVGDFNQPIIPGTIPNSVTILNFPSQFNQPIRIGAKNCIPESVTKLSFGRFFQQPVVKGSLTNSITELCLGGIDSNQVIEEGCIPNSVVKLKVGENQIFQENSLPINLQSLEGINSMYIKEIPLGITNFTFLEPNDPIEYLSNIPKHIVTIDVGGLFDNKEFERSIIPSHLTSLTFGNQFNQRILPSYLHNCYSLKSIKFGYYFNQIIFPCSLPDSITYLEFNQRFNQILSNATLPKNLKTLILGNEFNQPIKSNSLPQKLISFKIGSKSSFNQTIYSDSLPSTIKLLELGNRVSNQEFSKDWLPESLEHLILHGAPEFKLPLPPKLKFLYVKNNNHVFLDSISKYGSQLINLLKIIEENSFNNLFYILTNSV